MKFRFTTIASAFLILAFASSALSAETIESGIDENVFIELYTSEGCSSCPPADAWLSGLVSSPELWQTYIPLAFHVDYWNNLGWPDPFSDVRHSHRQRVYQIQGSINTVYTPEFVIQGKEWRSWLEDYRLPPPSGRQVGNLRIELEEKSAVIRFEPLVPLTKGLIHLARLGFGIERRISRGENQGKTLREDFVVLDHRSKPAEKQGSTLIAEFQRTPLRKSGFQKSAVVAWITNEPDQRPVQSAGGWITGGY